jgi:hypothetical protein
MVCVQAPGAAAPDADPDPGPDTGPESVPDGDTQVMYRYAVNAEADPGLVSRALEPFARLNIVPQAVHAVLEPPSTDGQPARQTLEIAATGLERMMADHIAAMLRQIPMVESVLFCEERDARRA